MKMIMYTSAVVSGMMYPRSFFEIKYKYSTKLSPYRNTPSMFMSEKLNTTLPATNSTKAPSLEPNLSAMSPADVVKTYRASVI